MSLIPSGLKNEIKNKFSELRKELSKVVYLYLEPNKTDCPNCFISTGSGSSTNTYNSSFVTPVVIYGNTITPTSFTRGRCPICSAKGVLEQENKVAIKSIVRWNPISNEGNNSVTPAGTEGINIVQLKSDRCYYERLRDCKYALIDGIKCELLNPPVIRSVNSVDIVVVSYFSAVKVGNSVRG